MGDVQTSRRAALLLTRRFELLGPGALTLLTMGAVLGKEFDLGLAVALTGQPASEVTPALDELRRRRILWVDDGPTEAEEQSESRCSFAHDKLRETLLSRLATAECMDLHRRAAERIEATDAERVFELAYHFDAAGEGERALPYALRSADLARSRHSLDVAAAQYRIAERAAATPRPPDTASGADTVLQARIAEGLGDVLTLQGTRPRPVASSNTPVVDHRRRGAGGARRQARRCRLQDRRPGPRPPVPRGGPG